jgi:hypothetical protein
MHQHACFGSQRTTDAGSHRALEALPGVPVMQQRVGLLPRNIEMDTARHGVSRKDSAELRADSGDSSPCLRDF